MGQTTPPSTDPSPPSPGGPRACSRVSPADQRLALAVLLTGRPAPRDPAVDQFLRFSAAQKLNLDDLWLAHDRATGRPVAATLLVPCPGRTALQFVSPVTADSNQAAATELIRTAAEAQDPRAVRLIQSLLDPGQDRTQRLLEAAGFHELATLTYMQARATRRSVPLELAEENLRILHWAEANREAFAAAILASYKQTQDCPGLLGLRQIDDIIAGHMASGMFRPELWYALYRDQTPAGVMLLNEVPHNNAFELVYLGLSPAFRGRGLARRLLEHALAVVAAQKRSTLILAVDEQNTPAVRLYRGMGFQSTGSKRAMIRVPPA